MFAGSPRLEINFRVIAVYSKWIPESHCRPEREMIHRLLACWRYTMHMVTINQLDVFQDCIPGITTLIKELMESTAEDLVLFETRAITTSFL